MTPPSCSPIGHAVSTFFIDSIEAIEERVLSAHCLLYKCPFLRAKPLPSVPQFFTTKNSKMDIVDLVENPSLAICIFKIGYSTYLIMALIL